MSRKRQTNTPERLEAAPGYVPSGISIYSRNIAHHVSAAGLKDFSDRLSPHGLIAKHERQLSDLRFELRDAPKSRREHIERDIRAKENFLKKLRVEQEHGASA